MPDFDHLEEAKRVLRTRAESNEGMQTIAQTATAHALIAIAEALQEPEVGIDPDHMRRVVENSKDHSCRVGQHQSCTSNWCHCYCHNPERKTHV